MTSPDSAKDEKSGFNTSVIFKRSVTPVFQDVTVDFFSAIKDLSLGELVHCPSFSLEDSISALEMMDPKMDSGLEINRLMWDVNAELDPYKILGLLDKTFAAEMSWQSGYFLSQTVFTNIFIQELLERKEVININDFYFKNEKDKSIYKNLTDVVLWPFMIASIKTCGVLNESFSKGFLYEEEEISSNCFGLSLLEYIDVAQSLDLLKFSISWLNDHSHEFNEKDQNYIKAIELRLKIKKKFLCALDSPFNVDVINDLEHIINIINKSISIIDFNDEIDVFFSTSIQARLSTTMPPRPIMILPVNIAYNNFENICKDFRKILLLKTEKISSLTPLNILVNFFKYFRAKRHYSIPFIRITLYSLFYSDNMILDKIPIDQFIMDSISEIYFPAKELFNILSGLYETYDGSKYLVFDSLNNFIKAAGIIYLNIFRIMCHNLSRQRQNFCKLILDLESLQEEAENIDVQLQFYFSKESVETSDHFLFPHIFSSWCFYEKLQIMILICFLGFELELHSSHELSLIYWYLDYLLGAYLAHLEKIINSSNLRFFRNKFSVVCFSEKDDTTISTIQRIKFDQNWNEGLQLMCNAFYKFFLVLKYFSFIHSPNKRQIPKSFMYKQRFKSFMFLKTPKFLDYEVFVEESDISHIPISQLLKEILNKFLEAKTIFNIIKKTNSEISSTLLCHDVFQENIENIIQSCIENELVCKTILEKVENNDLCKDIYVNINYKYHLWFPVISIISKS
ncbi:hypothetical protein PORY_001738 [Pneumocystis oryctolagi]|uniref:Uncharacterized protein n=1 Tax=Pneumocystis oryctolagi TaxID=42067 RepID=A0ACB7CB34_9ASCO|nr:hypothetical protein PORY_001738 [Pneumocystis oryctolagi]